MLARNLHQIKDGNTTIVAGLDGAQVVIGETRNEEHAAAGQIDSLRVVMSLTDAIVLAKAILEAATESEDAFIDRQWQMRLDYQAMCDDAIEADYEWIRHGC